MEKNTKSGTSTSKDSQNGSSMTNSKTTSKSKNPSQNSTKNFTKNSRKEDQKQNQSSTGASTGQSTSQKKNQSGKQNLIPPVDENIGKIETPLFLTSLTLKEMKWSAKLVVRTLLPRSYHRYKVILQLDEQPWLDRIADYEKELDDSLFKNEKTSKKELSRRVADQRKDLEETRQQCEKIEFSAIVDALRYKDNDTAIELRVPDDVIEPLNRQKVRMPLYKIALIPLL